MSDTEINKKELISTYNSEHSFCPNCGSDNIEQTCVGYIFYDIETFKDENRAICSCGWRGIVHDLKPAKKRA